MKHCISIVPQSSYSRILDLIAEDDASVEARELTNEHDGSAPYQLLTLVTDVEVSPETEKAIDGLSNVIVSTFNIEK
jgi:hypothetical protein